jgi:hypothetical protein
VQAYASLDTAERSTFSRGEIRTSGTPTSRATRARLRIDVAARYDGAGMLWWRQGNEHRVCPTEEGDKTASVSLTREGDQNVLNNESLERALEQARELQQSIIDAFSKATDEIKPQIESSLHTARDLQATFAKHMEAEAEMVCKNTAAAKSRLEDYLTLGFHALQESSEQTRGLAKKMIQQAVKVVDAAAAAADRSTAAPAKEE